MPDYQEKLNKCPRCGKGFKVLPQSVEDNPNRLCASCQMTSRLFPAGFSDAIATSTAPHGTTPPPEILPDLQDDPNAIGYASIATNRDSYLHAHDRYMAARLSLALGNMACACAIIVPVTMLVGAALIGGEITEPALVFASFPFVAYLIFGLTARAIARSIKHGAMASAAVALVFASPAFLINVASMVLLPWFWMFAGERIVVIASEVITAILVFLYGKLAFHCFRLLVYRGTRGGTARTETDLKDVIKSNVARFFGK